MTFSEYALGLSPFISYGKSEHDYFTELIGNFIKDAAMDSCKVLKRQPDTKYRYIKGTRLIQPKDAQYLYDHRDIDKFSQWIWDRMGDTDSYDSVVDWLSNCGITDAIQQSRAPAYWSVFFWILSMLLLYLRPFQSRILIWS